MINKSKMARNEFTNLNYKYENKTDETQILRLKRLLNRETGSALNNRKRSNFVKEHSIF